MNILILLCVFSVSQASESRNDVKIIHESLECPDKAEISSIEVRTFNTRDNDDVYKSEIFMDCSDGNNTRRLIVEFYKRRNEETRFIAINASFHRSIVPKRRRKNCGFNVNPFGEVFIDGKCDERRVELRIRSGDLEVISAEKTPFAVIKSNLELSLGQILWSYHRDVLIYSIITIAILAVCLKLLEQ